MLDVSVKMESFVFQCVASKYKHEIEVEIPF